MRKYKTALQKLPGKSQELQELYELPKYPSGVYSTIADQELLAKLPSLEKVDESNIEEGPKSMSDNIAKSVNAMFNRMSSTSDTRFFMHSNGWSNLLYGSSVPKASNAELKGDEQEAQVAMLQYERGRGEARTNEVYFGTSVNTKRK